MIQGLAGTGYVSNVYLFGAAGMRRNSDIFSPVKPVTGIKPLSSNQNHITAVASYDKDNTELFQKTSLPRTAQEKKLLDTYESMEQVQYDLSNPYESARMATEGMLLTGLHVNQLV